MNFEKDFQIKSAKLYPKYLVIILYKNITA